jgi:tRNA(Ile)-lysidine synthase
MLATKVLRTLERFPMLDPGDRVLVGLSGGADSVALTEVLFELRARLGIDLTLAHLNHGLRDDADEDEAFCRDLSREKNLPFAAGRADVAESARRSKRSVEDEGRRARYEFLEEQRERFGAQKIAVGHTLDDQAETFLLRLLRGSGGRGLASIHPVKDGRILRPLIEASRAEIEAFLRSRGRDFREDSSNLDPAFTRNRVRHQEIPRLSSSYNPRLAESLARSASLLRDEEEWMEALTKEAFVGLASASRGEVRLDRRALGRAPLALRRRLVRAAIESVRSLENVTHGHVEEVLALAERARSGRELHLPGLLVETSFDDLRFRALAPGGARKARERGYNEFEYRLSIPAQVRIPECSGTFSAGVAEGDGAAREAYGNAVVVGFEGRLPELRVRAPRAGDRFHPLGAPGSKPLSRYLMERKVSREVRSRVPLLVAGDSGEEILWVVGHGVSESSRVSRGAARLALTWVTP